MDLPRFHLSIDLSTFASAALINLKKKSEIFSWLLNWRLTGTKNHGIDLFEADVKSLQKLLRDGSITSAALVNAYLEQIHCNEGYLHAMLSMPSKENLQRFAKTMDDERAAGKCRSPYHGIPIILKDNINTHPDLGMKTTCGSLALEHARPLKNAELVENLLAAGMIIIGKANMGELSDCRGENVPSGWSALGGQTQSPYVRGGLLPDDSKLGHSSTLGSSSGSAVAVAAGFAPVTVGTETDGSLVGPSSRAALFTIKPTIGVISQVGICPVSHTMDSAGPMTKTVYDLAALMDVLSEKDAPGYPVGGYTTLLPCSMDQFSVATVDFTEWIFPADLMKPEQTATDQMNREFQFAYDKIKLAARKYSDKVPLIKPQELMLHGVSSKSMVVLTDFRHDFQKYLDTLESKPVENLQSLIDHNQNNAAKELPPGHASQAMLEAAVALSLTKKEYYHHLENLRHLSRNEGIDRILNDYDADVIIGPADSSLSTIAAASGYPIAAMPLGYLKLNGRPFGMVALAGRYQEATLIKFMAAWEEVFPKRRHPQLIETSWEHK